MKHMNARAFKAMVAAVFAISATVVPISQSFAAGEALGKPRLKAVSREELLSLGNQ